MSEIKVLPFSFRVLLVGYSVLHILPFCEPPILLPPRSIKKYWDWFYIIHLIWEYVFIPVKLTEFHIEHNELFITETHITQNCSLWWFDLWFKESCNNGELLDLNSRKFDRLIIELICVKQYLPFCFSNVFPIIVTEASRISFSFYSLMN